MNDMSSVDATLLLTNRVVPLPHKPLRAKEYWGLRAYADPGQMIGWSAAEITEAVGDPALGERIAGLFGAATPFTLAREDLERKGIEMLAPGDGKYPERLINHLGAAAPPMLYAAGPIEWLAEPLVGVVGSRNVEEAGAAVASGVADVAARIAAGVVSGGARGVDLIAMNAAHQCDIPVVGITADGLERAGRRKELRDAVGREQLLLVSPFAPEAGFSVGNAMGRNKLIYALAFMTLVVASDLESGGTWAGATEALRREFGRVAVWRGEGAGPGNEALIEHGADVVEDLETWTPDGDPIPDRSRSSAQLRLGI